MSPTDVTKILERLARIETKIDGGKDQAGRIRRLELTVVALLAYTVKEAAKAAGVL